MWELDGRLSFILAVLVLVSMVLARYSYDLACTHINFDAYATEAVHCCHDGLISTKHLNERSVAMIASKVGERARGKITVSEANWNLEGRIVIEVTCVNRILFYKMIDRQFVIVDVD